MGARAKRARRVEYDFHVASRGFRCSVSGHPDAAGSVAGSVAGTAAGSVAGTAGVPGIPGGSLGVPGDPWGSQGVPG